MSCEGGLAELLAENDSQYTPETEHLLDDIAAYMMAGGEMNPGGWVEFVRPFGKDGSLRKCVDGPGANRRLDRLSRGPFGEVGGEGNGPGQGERSSNPPHFALGRREGVHPPDGLGHRGAGRCGELTDSKGR